MMVLLWSRENLKKYDENIIKRKKLILHLLNGEDMELPHENESAKKICDLLKANEIATIHSSEPTLETVFLELTGRNLQEEE